MTATRPTGRARRTALAVAGLGVAALAVAPAASATSSSKPVPPVPAYAGGVVPPPGSTTLPPVSPAPGGTTPVGTTPVGTTPVGTAPGGTTPVGTAPGGTTPVKAPGAPATKHHAAPVKHTTKKSTHVLGHKYSSRTLAYTGAEVGGVATTGLVLVVGGALLVRSGRRRPTTA